jgi:hypothetical protein
MHQSQQAELIQAGVYQKPAVTAAATLNTAIIRIKAPMI